MGAFTSQHYRFKTGFAAVDFAFVVRGSDRDYVQFRERGHVLSTCADAADEVDLLVAGFLRAIVEVVKIAISFSSVHDLLNIFGRQQLFTVEPAALNDCRADFHQVP